MYKYLRRKSSNRIIANKSANRFNKIFASSNGPYTAIYNAEDSYGGYGSQMLFTVSFNANNDEDAVYKAFDLTMSLDKDEIDDVIDGSGVDNIFDLQHGVWDLEYSADVRTLVCVLKGSKVIFNLLDQDINAFLQNYYEFVLEDHLENDDDDEIYNWFKSRWPNGWNTSNFRMTKQEY